MNTIGSMAIEYYNDIKESKLIKALTIIAMIAAMLFIAITPAFAADGEQITTAYKSLAQSLFTLIQGLFACTCCVVILISLFLMLIATDDRGVQSGIHRIKVAIACLVVAFLVPFIIQKVLAALSGGNSSGDIQNLELPS